jgi:Zn-dependent protease with chaperone function
MGVVMAARRFYPIEGGTRDLPWLLLYAITFALQLLCAFARGIFFLIPVALVLAIAGIEPFFGGGPYDADQLICAAIAFLPLAFSLTALVYPLGAGRYWQVSSGGRAPSDRERDVYDQALEQLKQRNPEMRTPGSWFVLDDYALNAAVLGDTLMISTGTLQDPGLLPVLAHELGHLNTMDGYLSVALNRIAAPATLWYRATDGLGDGWFATLFIFTGWICSGAVALRVVRPLWDAWFRAREFKADEYAAKLGQADELAVALEHHALADDRPIPFRFLSGASHPSTEHRIQALNNYQPDEQPHATRHELHQTRPIP